MVRKLETLAAGAETLQAYLRQIAGMPRLSADEERDLARRVRQHNDEHALSRLVEAHLRVVVAYARRYRQLGVPALDLIHEGNLGLIAAARRYEPESGLPFLAHAFWWIRQAMLHLIAASHAGLSIETDHLEGAGNGLHIAALQAAIEGGPVSVDVVDQMVADDEEAHQTTAIVFGGSPWAGQHAEGEEPPAEAGVLLALRPPDRDDQLTRDAIAHAFEAQLAAVDPRARQILRLRCGLHGADEWTLEQVAVKLGMSAGRVAEVEADARHTLSRHRALESHLN